MEESGTITGKQTLEYSNVSSESPLHNAPVLTRGDHAVELPSDRVTASSGMLSVSSRLNIDEDIIHVRIRMSVHVEHSGVGVVARSQCVNG